MFCGASAFNSNIKGWDMSSVTDMRVMFNLATSFNADVSGWVLSNVEAMDGAFAGMSSFNPDVANWQTPSASSMKYLFDFSAIDKELCWDVSDVETTEMFKGCDACIDPGCCSECDASLLCS